MMFSRLLACLLGLVALAFSWYVHEEYVRLLGFPDGHVTELGAAEKNLALVFNALSLPLAGYLLYLGGIARAKGVGARLATAVGWYVLVLAGAVLVDRYLQSRLDGGIGG